jgi:hypothetical protein
MVTSREISTRNNLYMAGLIFLAVSCSANHENASMLNDFNSDGIVLNQMSFVGGPGCPDGTVADARSFADNTLALKFNSFNVTNVGGSGPGVSSKTCYVKMNMTGTMGFFVTDVYFEGAIGQIPLSGDDISLLTQFESVTGGDIFDARDSSQMLGGNKPLGEVGPGPFRIGAGRRVEESHVSHNCGVPQTLLLSFQVKVPPSGGDVRTLALSKAIVKFDTDGCTGR